jgi:rsbT co-antagonist protein RsbR
MLMALIAAAILALPLIFVSTSVIVTVTTILLVLLSAVIALSVLRRGRARLSIVLAASGGVMALAIPLFSMGLNQNGDVLLYMLIPITMAALMGERRGLLTVIGLAILAVVAPVVLAALWPALVSNTLPARDQTANFIGAFLLTTLLVALVLDRFSAAFREALQAARAREHELKQMGDSLEATVATRTAELEAALRTSAEREARLADALAEVEQQRNAIREMSVPVIPISDTTAVVPLIGTLDSARLHELQTQVLQAIERSKRRYLALDITGILLIDSQVALGIVNLVRAVRLLGAEVLLVGIRPEVAQSIVGLGLNLPVRTFSDLKEALLRVDPHNLVVELSDHPAA